MVLRKPDLVAGSTLLLAGCFFGGMAWLYFPEGSGDVPGPAFFPEVLCSLFAASGVFLNVKAIRKKGLPSLRLQNLDKLIKVFLLIALYVAVFAWTGFFLSTTLFVAAMLALMNVRNPVQLVLVPLAATVLIWTLFRFYLGVPLP
jgi:hypothetical protein